MFFNKEKKNRNSQIKRWNNFLICHFACGLTCIHCLFIFLLFLQQPETVRKDIKFARSLALATKLKLPFPHMVAVVTVEATIPNSLQMFSQATGDIALDSCVDFWDGYTLRTLTSSDRLIILIICSLPVLPSFIKCFM